MLPVPFPFTWPLRPVVTIRLGLERRLEREAFLRVIEWYQGREPGLAELTKEGSPFEPGRLS